MDQTVAMHYFQLSADRGNVLAQCVYGIHLYKGTGTNVDRERAPHYFQLSVEQGNHEAQCICKCFLLQHKRSRDPEGLCHFQKAADTDLVFAQTPNATNHQMLFESAHSFRPSISQPFAKAPSVALEIADPFPPSIEKFAR
jgi:TPR repeat protein